MSLFQMEKKFQTKWLMSRIKFVLANTSWHFSSLRIVNSTRPSKNKNKTKQKKTKTSLQTLFLLLSLFLSNLLRRVSLSVYSLLILVAFSYFSSSLIFVFLFHSTPSTESTLCLCLAFGQLIFLINFVCLFLSVFPFFFLP